jgi:hypothetical protein
MRDVSAAAFVHQSDVNNSSSLCVEINSTLTEIFSQGGDRRGRKFRKGRSSFVRERIVISSAMLISMPLGLYNSITKKAGSIGTLLR